MTVLWPREEHVCLYFGTIDIPSDDTVLLDRFEYLLKIQMTCKQTTTNTT